MYRYTVYICMYIYIYIYSSTIYMYAMCIYIYICASLSRRRSANVVHYDKPYCSITLYYIIQPRIIMV